MSNHVILPGSTPRDIEVATTVIAGLQAQGLRFEVIWREDRTVDIRIFGH